MERNTADRQAISSEMSPSGETACGGRGYGCNPVRPMHAPKTYCVLWPLLTVIVMHHGLALLSARAEPAPELVTAAEVVADTSGSETDESVREVPAGFFSPDEIRCRAARASASGNLLAAEQAAVMPPRSGRCGGAGHASCVKRSMLGFAAEESRNRDAGTALQLYWSLAEAIHSRPALDTAIASADRALADHATVATRGLELPIDKTSLTARRLVLQDNQIALDVATATLTHSLQLAAALPPTAIDTARPGEDEPQLVQELDVDALVAEALATRPELRMWRMLQANLDADTVPVASAALATISPALGGSEAAKPCGLIIGRSGSRRESDLAVRKMSRQLKQWRQFREAAVADEVRRAAIEGNGNAERARAAQARLVTAEQALADLRAKQPADGSDAFSIHAAELEVASARRTVVERLAAWERSRVALWQAQGVLARRCVHGGE